MRIELHRTVPNDPELRDAWNSLVQCMDWPEVFYTYEWAQAVALAYGNFFTPWLLLAYEGSELTGVVALAVDAANRACFLCANTADYCDFLSSVENRPALVEMALYTLRKAGIRHIALANLPENSPTGVALSRLARAAGYHLGSRLGYLCARVKLGSHDQRSQLKAAIKKRKSYRYGMNALSRQGLVTLSHHTSWVDIAPLLQEFFMAHVARFLSMNRFSNIARADRRLFLTELGRLLSQCGWCVLTRLCVGDRTVAWNLGFCFAGSWFYYQPTFETSLEKYSPGVCLLSGIISDACDREDVRIVDLGLGAEGYKERFVHEVRKTLFVTLSQSQTSHVRQIARYRATELVKRSSRVESSVRATLATLTGIKRRVAWANSGEKLAATTRFLMDVLSGRQQGHFYEWMRPPEPFPALSSLDQLVAIDLGVLAKAVMICEDDVEAQEYLQRAARRLSSPTGDGFAVVDGNGEPLEFCWCSAFEGQHLGNTETPLSVPCPRAALIYDCFSPKSVRSRGQIGRAPAALVQRLLKEGRTPWACVTGGQGPWMRALEEMGFAFRYKRISRTGAAG